MLPIKRLLVPGWPGLAILCVLILGMGTHRAGAEPPVHARSGRRALKLAMAVIESHETGRIVAVDR